MKKLLLFLTTGVLLNNITYAQHSTKLRTADSIGHSLKSGHLAKNARYVFFYYIYTGVAEGNNGKKGVLYIGDVVDLNSFNCTLTQNFYCRNCNVIPANTWDKKYQCGLLWYEDKLKKFNIDDYFTSDWITVVTTADVYKNEHLIGLAANEGDHIPADKAVMERIRRKFVTNFGRSVVPVQ